MLACHVAIPLFHGCAMCWKMCWKMLFFHAAEHLKKEKKREQWVKTYTRKRLHDAKNCCKLAYDDANTGFFFFFFFCTCREDCRNRMRGFTAEQSGVRRVATEHVCLSDARFVQSTLLFKVYRRNFSFHVWKKKKKTLVIFAPHNRDMGESSTAHSFSYFCISRKF